MGASLLALAKSIYYEERQFNFIVFVSIANLILSQSSYVAQYRVTTTITT